jgi:sugar phosphate isomerase/epimerase
MAGIGIDRRSLKESAVRMKLSQVAAQLYTCRDLIQDAPGIAATLARLRKIGYTAVQVSGVGPVPYEEIGRILADVGMVCCTTHEPADDILDSPGKVVERLGALRCKMTAYPFPRGIDLSSRKVVDEWIARLQRAAEEFERAGLRLCYHNHNHEFRKLDGRPILELIYEGAPGLKAELDTYWIHYGGGDVIQWCRKMAGKFPVMHMKDYQTTAENAPLWSEIGEGNLDFKAIVSAAEEEAGCEWFAVEQDTCPGDPVDSLEKSFRYIQEHLVG